MYKPNSYNLINEKLSNTVFLNVNKYSIHSYINVSKLSSEIPIRKTYLGIIVSGSA